VPRPPQTKEALESTRDTELLGLGKALPRTAFSGAMKRPAAAAEGEQPAAGTGSSSSSAKAPKAPKLKKQAAESSSSSSKTPKLVQPATEPPTSPGPTTPLATPAEVRGDAVVQPFMLDIGPPPMGGFESMEDDYLWD
jgi:hypothetical protein